MWFILREHDNTKAVSRYAYSLVLNDQGKELYDSLKGVFQGYLDKDVEEKVLPSRDHELLGQVVSLWSNHVTTSKLSRDFLMYLDNVYCENAIVPKVYEYAIDIFRKNVLPRIRPRLIAVVLEQIRLEREGELVSRPTLKRVTEMLLETNEYATMFQEELLESSRKYYDAERIRQLAGANADAYLANVKRRLKEETERCSLYLSSESLKHLHAIIDEELISKALHDLINVKDEIISSIRISPCVDGIIWISPNDRQRSL